MSTHAMTRRVAALGAAAIVGASVLTWAQAPPQMVSYQMVLFRVGHHPMPDADRPRLYEEAAAHRARLNARNLVIADGTFFWVGREFDRGALRELAIVDVPGVDAARALFEDEPRVKAGYVELEVHPWWVQKDALRPRVEPPQPERLVLGFLVTGPTRTQSAADAQEIQRGHIAYMEELHKQGKLVGAGPFGDDGRLRGIVVYRVGTPDEARQLAAGDPAVKAGRLAIEPHWWNTWKGIFP